MSRLNQSIREAIVDAAIAKAGINERIKANAARRLDWNDRVRVQLNGMTDAELDALSAEYKALLARIPKHLGYDYQIVGKRTYGAVNLAGITVRLDFDSYRYLGYDAGTLLAGDPLVDEFYALEDEKKQLTDEKQVLEAQLRGLLDGITTIKKLLEVWPEARELLPATEAKAANLPTVLVSSLNAAIGLPTEKDA